MPVGEANDVRERTLREARAIAALTHPNVVAVHDVAKQGAEPFVVMELVPGRSLARLIGRSGALNTEQAAAVADALAAGLDAAHRRGITHRDVKPGNVLVGADGQVKLTDFGISRNVSEVTMTSSGLVLGTPAYIAPEVAAGEPVTNAADLWSLGATLFAAVTGHPPYDAGNVLETVNEVVHGDIPEPPADSPMSSVISGLMVKDPAARISLVEVRRRIRPLLAEPGSPVFPPDEAEPDAGPADNKPTTNLSAEPAPPETAAPGQLAPAPGPLPFALPPAVSTPLAPVPGPLPFARPPVRRHRGRVAGSLLVVLAVLLFAAAAGGGFVAARVLAGRPLLPPSHTNSAPPSSVPQAPPVKSFTTVATQAAVTPGTPGGNFSVSVPVGWTKFVEQRGKQTLLPDSTVVRWVKSDGLAELTVERFPEDNSSSAKENYLTALTKADPAGNLQISNTVTDEYQFRTGDTARTMYFDLKQVGADLWVLSVTVPTVQEGSGQTQLFDKIRTTFTVTS
jgi:serine/threonine protein kinase